MLLICQNATMQVEKHIAHLVALFWFPAGSRRATGCARICETPFLYLTINT